MHPRAKFTGRCQLNGHLYDVQDGHVVGFNGRSVIRKNRAPRPAMRISKPLTAYTIVSKQAGDGSGDEAVYSSIYCDENPTLVPGAATAHPAVTEPYTEANSVAVPTEHGTIFMSSTVEQLCYQKRGFHAYGSLECAGVEVEDDGTIRYEDLPCSDCRMYRVTIPAGSFVTFTGSFMAKSHLIIADTMMLEEPVTHVDPALLSNTGRVGAFQEHVLRLGSAIEEAAMSWWPTQ